MPLACGSRFRSVAVIQVTLLVSPNPDAESAVGLFDQASPCPSLAVAENRSGVIDRKVSVVVENRSGITFVPDGDLSFLWNYYIFRVCTVFQGAHSFRNGYINRL